MNREEHIGFRIRQVSNLIRRNIEKQSEENEKIQPPYNRDFETVRYLSNRFLVYFVIGFITNTTVATIAYYVGRFLFYLWWMLYLPCFSCCKYADYTETHRADLKIKMF